MRRTTYQGPNRTRLRITARGMALLNVILAGCLAVAIAALAVWWISLAADRVPLPQPGAVIAGVAPCQSEDSTGCYWDASARGNGDGASFYATPDGEVIPWCTDALAVAGAQCWGPIR